MQSYTPNVQAWAYDQYGNPVGSGSTQTGPGLQAWLANLAANGAAQGWKNTQNRLGAINPQTGLPYNGTMPMTSGDNAYIQSQLSQSANSFNNNLYQQQLAMLGYGGGGGGMSGAGGGGGFQFMGGNFNPLNGTGGGPQVTGMTPGGNGFTPGGNGYGNQPQGTAPFNPASIPVQSGTPMANPNQANGNLPMGVDPGLSGAFNSILTSSMTNPGYTPGQIQGMKDNASDSLSSAQSQALLMGGNQAAAAGMGNSGASLAAQNAIHSDYAGQISNAQRGIDIGAANEAQAQKMQALGTAGGYLSSMYANQMHARDLAIGLMSQQKQTAPSGGGGSANWSGNSGGGGLFNGANVGPNSGGGFNFTGSNGGGFGGFSGAGIVNLGNNGGGYGGYSNNSGGNGGAPQLPPGQGGADPFSSAQSSMQTANPFSQTQSAQTASAAAANPFAASAQQMGAQNGAALARPKGRAVNPFVYNPVMRTA